MREGNEGIDCNINFLPPLRLGDDPMSQLGEEILLPFGEQVLMQAIGEVSPRRISGISSSGTVWKCLAWGQREFGFPSFWLANNAEPEMVVTKDLGGFPFEEKGKGSNGLSHRNELRSINKGYQYILSLYLTISQSISNLESRNGVETTAESGWSSIFWVSVFCKAFSTAPLSLVSVSSSGSASIPIGAEPEWKNIYKELTDYI